VSEPSRARTDQPSCNCKRLIMSSFEMTKGLRLRVRTSTGGRVPQTAISLRTQSVSRPLVKGGRMRLNIVHYVFVLGLNLWTESYSNEVGFWFSQLSMLNLDLERMPRKLVNNCPNKNRRHHVQTGNRGARTLAFKSIHACSLPTVRGTSRAGFRADNTGSDN
jgi:hypothetical protein